MRKIHGTAEGIKKERVNERLNLIEGIIEEVITKALPEAQLSKQKINEIKKSIKEMKRGNYQLLSCC